MPGGSERLLSNLTACIALLDGAERSSANLTFDPDDPKLAEVMRFDHRVDCFEWAVERCLGQAFTPELRAAHRKLTLFAAQVARGSRPPA